jgi:hypothetical protein
LLETKLPWRFAAAKHMKFVLRMKRAGLDIEFAIDINPPKRGKSLPGAGHPIVNYKELQEGRCNFTILVNPAYWEENPALTRDARIEVHIGD